MILCFLETIWSFLHYPASFDIPMVGVCSFFFWPCLQHAEVYILYRLHVCTKVYIWIFVFLCVCISEESTWSALSPDFHLGVSFRSKLVVTWNKQHNYINYNVIILHSILYHIFFPFHICVHNSKLPTSPTKELLSLFGCILTINYKTWWVWKLDNFRGCYDH